MTLPIKDAPLALLQQRTLKYATLWTITRTDGEGGHEGDGNYRFTDHNHLIKYSPTPELTQTDDYHPVAGFNASAREKRSGLRSQNFEAIGIISADIISAEDLRQGKFREASITEVLVDWQHPWQGPFYIHKYFIKEISWSGQVWEAQVIGLSGWLQQPIGEFYGRTCRYDLGDDRCTVDLNALDLEGRAITFVGAAVIGVGPVIREAFTSDIPNLYPDKYFKYGTVTWLTGANVGLTYEVAAHLEEAGAVALRLATYKDIVIGDTFTIIGGCDKLLGTCRDKFNNVEGAPGGNVINFGGFPTIPGLDKMLETPNVK